MITIKLSEKSIDLSLKLSLIDLKSISDSTKVYPCKFSNISKIGDRK